MRLGKARKPYTCDITGKTIVIGEIYCRVNLREHGIFHFKEYLEINQIKDFLLTNYILPELNDYLEIWAGTTDEF